jgi:hypothetical protein
MHLSIFAWKAFSCCCFIIWRRKWQSIHAMAFPPWTDAPIDWILECAGRITLWRSRETLPRAGASTAGLSSPICTCTACVPTGTGCLHCGCMSPRAGAESLQERIKGPTASGGATVQFLGGPNLQQSKIFLRINSLSGPAEQKIQRNT